MLNLFFLNRKIEELLKQNELAPGKLKQKLKDVLIRDFIKRVRPDLIEQIKLLFADDKEFIRLIDGQFTPIKSETGKTYVLFVRLSDFPGSYKREGYCFLLKVFPEQKDDKKTSEIAKFNEAYKVNFENCLNYVAKVINEELEDAYFILEGIDKLSMRLLDPFNEYFTNEDVDFYGDSLELPLAISIFSFITGIEISNSIACSGNVNEALEITYVDGMKEKILAAIKEYPEIKTFVFSEDCRRLNVEKEIKGVEIKYVRDIKEAFEVFFSNWKQLINKEKFPGKIQVKLEKVILENGLDATKIIFNYDYSSSLNPKILPSFIKKILEKKLQSESSRIFLLYDFRPNWFTAALMPSFVNKSDAVGVYNKEFDSYVIVYTGRSFNKFSVGDQIKLKNS